MAWLTGVTWSVLAIGLKAAVEFTDAATISWIRFVISAAFLAAFFLLFRTRELRKISRLPVWIFVAALGLAANYDAFVRAVGSTNASHSVILIQMGPLLLALIGAWLFKEKFTKRHGLGLLLAALGFWFFAQDQLAKASDPGLFQEGNLWLVWGSLTWVLWALIQKKLSRDGWSPQFLNLVVFSLCALILWPIATPAELTTWSLSEWILIFALGLNTLIGYGALALALEHAPVHEVSVIISFYPLLTLALVQLIDFFQWLPLKPEPLGWVGGLGACFVIAGIVLSVKKSENRGR